MAVGKLSQIYFVDDEVKKLVEETLGCKRGDSISPEEIEKITGFERGSTPFNKTVKKWKDKVFAATKVDVEYNAGRWWFQTADQQVLRCHNKQTRHRREERRVALVAGVVDPKELSEEGKKLQAAVVADATENVKRMDHQIKARKPMLVTYQPLPRPNGDK